MWRYLYTVGLVMASLCLQAATLTGVVKDSRTNKGIPFALIYIQNIHEPHMADEDGFFEVDLKPGIYHLEFS